MIHATDATLDKLESLLERVRLFTVLKEKRRGVFYHKSNAFLHFHEDTSGLFADLKSNRQWARFAVNTRQDYQALLAKIEAELGN